MFGSIGSVFAAVVAKLVAWQEREIARAELESLDDRALADIGLTRGDIPGILTGRFLRPEALVEVAPSALAANTNSFVRKAA
jgi:uncharacterized protein YjiS (DUF1127 family)